jgi:hypothetical protein
VTGAGAKLATVKSPFPRDGDIRDGDRQHLLVHVDSRDPVWHTHLHGGSGERASIVLLRVTGCDDAHLFAQARTSRIIQLTGFNCSTGSIDLTARTIPIFATAPQIFIRFRELMSARGNALLKLSKPVDDNVHLHGRSRLLRLFDH